MIETITHNNFSLPKLSSYQKNKFFKYAEQVLLFQQKILTSCGKNILHYILQDQSHFLKNKHYPTGERIDFQNGGQYFYHCHRENYTTEEHGHFHCFLRRTAIPKYIKPFHYPQKPSKESQQMTHLIAISINRIGQPIRLFTINHWLSHEVAYHSRYIANLTRRFKLDIQENLYWRNLDKWIEGVIQIFLPQIIWLHQQKASQINLLTKNHENIFANRKIEELSSIPIDLVKQIEWIIQEAEDIPG